MSENWNDLPEKAQEDLIEWYNVRKPDAADKKRLAALYFAGRFHAWNCISCKTRVYYGEPEKWAHFQGVCQADYCSYPGDGTARSSRMCDHCRMYCVHDYAEELELTGADETEPSAWIGEESETYQTP